MTLIPLIPTLNLLWKVISNFEGLLEFNREETMWYEQYDTQHIEERYIDTWNTPLLIKYLI